MLKSLQVSKTERRVVIILMIINSFAYFVNKFGLSGKINSCWTIFTNTTNRRLYEIKGEFYPFVEFVDRSWCFNGLFPSYDSSEFFVYTLLIFGILIIKKIW